MGKPQGQSGLLRLRKLAERELSQVLQVAGSIDVGEEARLAIIPALHDMLGHAGEIDAGLAGHVASMQRHDRDAGKCCLR